MSGGLFVGVVVPDRRNYRRHKGIDDVVLFYDDGAGSSVSYHLHHVAWIPDFGW